MPGVSASALRRALAEMADLSADAGFSRSIPMAMQNTAGGAAFGGAVGGLGGVAANMPRNDGSEDLDQYTDRLLGGIGRGAALGAGIGAGAVGFAGLRGGLRQALSDYAVSHGTRRLASVKREALNYVRNNPVAVQRVMAAKDEDEIDAIVNDVISKTRVRGYGNY